VYTIKQAAKLSGVPEASLRAWERRYAVVTPRRTDAGYRIYDDESVAAATAMRTLVEAGWAPVEAARAVREGLVGPTPPAAFDRSAAATEEQKSAGWASAVACMQLFLNSAAAMDVAGIETSLDQGFALGSFEHVVDSWLFPTLEALGEGWVRGEIEVAGEHAASHAVHRRLSAAFEAAGRRSRGPGVIVGLPPGGQHELGALAFATAARRLGLDVLYLGADVPEASWLAAVRARSARSAVLCVVTDEDRVRAVPTAERLVREMPGLVVASGGATGDDLTVGAHTLPPTISSGARWLDDLLHS
jgi:methanogenic corrinoid protein MtbC1